jgi:3-phosphoglycerate kinase
LTTIDDKVVAISFENSKFQSGVAQTISSLEKLKAALHFPTAGKGLADIDAAAKKVDLSHISKGVDGVKRSLESLRLVAIGVIVDTR